MKLPNFHFFSTSFVSLVITPSKIKAVRLSKSRDKVEVMAQSDIPPGIISSYRVNNHDELVKRIKLLWSENKIKEKYVGVVVPEFSTYTKSITLPNLSDSEVNEALTWQIQEFLPANIDDVISDWQIIDRKKDEMEILVVAILKDILYGYIDAVGDAGLMPLVVETPSLSIERITRDQDESKLVLYVNSPEAILVITKGRRIVASSVVSSQNANIIVNTALQMVSHYSDIKITSIIVSGMDLNQEMIENLHNNMGIPVKLFSQEIGGISASDFQNYLVAVSLQFKNPAEPMDNSTINLLPPNWSSLYRGKQKYTQYWLFTLIVSFFTWSTFLAAFIVMMLLGLQAEDFNRKVTQNGGANLNALATDVKTVNTSIDKYLLIKQSIQPFQKIINEIEEKAGQTITISNYSINMENGQIVIQARAITPQAILDFKQSMQDSENFTSIDIPITLTSREVNLDFEMKAVYKPLSVPTTQKPVKLKL